MSSPDTKPSLRRRYSHSVWQLLRFGVVGGLGFLLNMGVMIVLHKLHGGTANASQPLIEVSWSERAFRYRHLVFVLSFLIANLFNFQLNRSWTFKSAKHAKWFKEFWPFLMIGSIAAGLGLLIQILLTQPHSPLYLSSSYFTGEVGLRDREYWAQMIAILVVMPVNFLVNKLWTFRAVRSKNLKTDDEVVE